MRKTCLNTVAELLEYNARAFFIGSDLGSDIMRQFCDCPSGQFLMEGISEANLVGVAAGLALEGRVVYFNTIATFITRRAYEQVALDVCLHRANVRLLGNGGGVVYSVLGPSHMATEDLALMRALPGMTVLVPADPGEMRRAMWATLDYEGPVYVRISRGGERQVTSSDHPFEIGRLVPIMEGRDVLLICTGVALQICIDAAEHLKSMRIHPSIIHVPTLKPLDAERLIERLACARVVVSVEEHTMSGGLGSAVAELIAETPRPASLRFKRIGLPDSFLSIYASQRNVMSRLGISPHQVVDTVVALYERPGGMA